MENNRPHDFFNRSIQGGLKAVIWTDALQGFIMLAGQLAGLIGGLIYVGGFSNVYDALERSDRLNMFT